MTHYVSELHGNIFVGGEKSVSNWNKKKDALLIQMTLMTVAKR